MILKKVYFPIFVFFTILLVLQSCDKKQKNKTEKKSNLVEIDRLIDLGDIHFDKAAYDSAYYYHNYAKSLCDTKKDNTRILYSLAVMSKIQYHQGDFSGCETTSIESIPFLNNKIDPAYECSIYNMLGVVYVNQFDYENALYYYNKALNLNIDKTRKLNIKHNIAVVYMAKKEYNKAIEILLPLTLKKEKNDDISFSNAYENLGYSYYKVGNPKGIDYLNKSLKLKKQINDDWGMATNYIFLARCYTENNQKLSCKYAQLGYEKSTKINSVDNRLESLALLIQNSSENESKKFSLLYLNINDSINKVKQIAKNQFAKIKYDSKKEKEENLSLKAQKAENALRLEREKTQKLLLFIIVVIVISSALFLINYLTVKNKREKIKTSYDTETRISKKLHDELANDVYQTMAFAETQDLSSDKNREVLVNNLDTIYSRTRNISKENSVIETGIHFVPNLKEMLSGFNTHEVNVLVNGLDAIHWSAIEISKKITVYRVLQELLVNMKKHSQCSLAVITFNKNENILHIDYSDNGVGAVLEEINLKNGLLNVENRIQAIKGTLTFDSKSNKGFKVNLLIPL